MPRSMQYRRRRRSSDFEMRVTRNAIGSSQEPDGILPGHPHRPGIKTKNPAPATGTRSFNAGAPVATSPHPASRRRLPDVRRTHDVKTSLASYGAASIGTLSGPPATTRGIA
jgi:hypothetical protein